MVFWVIPRWYYLHVGFYSRQNIDGWTKCWFIQQLGEALVSSDVYQNHTSLRSGTCLQMSVIWCEQGLWNWFRDAKIVLLFGNDDLVSSWPICGENLTLATLVLFSFHFRLFECTYPLLVMLVCTPWKLPWPFVGICGNCGNWIGKPKLTETKTKKIRQLIMRSKVSHILNKFAWKHDIKIEKMEHNVLRSVNCCALYY